MSLAAARGTGGGSSSVIVVYLATLRSRSSRLGLGRACSNGNKSDNYERRKPGLGGMWGGVR